ncbi:MAG: hypothetical protein QW687_00910 [Candidatus Hadarchaeales archaeon]
MEIEIERRWAIIEFTILLVIVLLVFGAIGKAITPVEGGQAKLLTISRWQELKLRRAIASEKEKICKLALELETELGKADPIKAQLIKEKVAGTYLPHMREAEEMLLEAAEKHVEFALGGTDKDDEAARILRDYFGFCPGFVGERESTSPQGGKPAQGLP